MQSLKAGLFISAMMVPGTAAEARAQCDAPKSWFTPAGSPETGTPEPDFHAPKDDCEFHQWAWQTFLWLTQSTGPERIRLLDLPLAEKLFEAGNWPKTLDAAALEQLKKQPLVLSPRVVKRSAPNKVGDIRQVGLRGVLVDQNGRAIYYATHVSPIYYQFVRSNRLYLKEEYLKASPKCTFPVRSLTVKSSWRILLPGESTGCFTTSAFVFLLKCKNGTNNCQGEDVIKDDVHTPKLMKVALVGLHVAGVVAGHPEFIWSTFEHRGNVPDLPADMSPDSPEPVSGGAWTFYAPNTSAKDCNVANARMVTLDVRTQQLRPISNVFRPFALGGGDPADQANIKSLNESVRAQLEAVSVWRNYFLVGSVWFDGSNRLEPGLTGPYIQRRTTGSVRLSNSTMETFTQLGRKNCFSCHDSGARGDLGLPAMNMNLSHVLTDGLGQFDKLVHQRVAPIRVKAGPLKSYAEVRRLLNDFVEKNDVPIGSAPYGPFWEDMSYKEFIEGNIPGVLDPAGKPLKVLVVKNSMESNLVKALRGTKGSVFDPVEGTTGRLPPSGPFMNEGDIKQIADWIHRGCPNER
jgi:hypothetical protein